MPSPTDTHIDLHFHPTVNAWFQRRFGAPTVAQAKAWPAIASGANTLVFAPTGSGKTLSAFLGCIDRVMFSSAPRDERARCRVLYISPLKALAADVERNLGQPIAGILALARERGEPVYEPTLALRTGDTPQRERARLLRHPPDFLITTPESLYLLLTGAARETLRHVETVIIDEIHALVPSKRGAHLMLSVERLAQLCGRPLQRIGLSATQRPLDEVARFLGGFSEDAEGALQQAPVVIADARMKKRLALRIESALPDPDAAADKPADMWAAVHPRLVSLIRSHRSTLIFVNNRRTAERLAAAINVEAGLELAFAHHGSLARPQRVRIEEQLKAGQIPALVCTSSLELGVDMGAIDLVVQIEAPPSVASALQRIGRAGHQVGAESQGLVFPKYRGDLVACAAVARAMLDGAVESTRYPRNPLDVLAQQVVAMVAMDKWEAAELYRVVRRAAPFAELPRTAFDNVLDMLSGRYAADALVDLKPRLTWDRTSGALQARQGSKQLAIASGGTIPDRGLFGVYLAGGEAGKAKVGELDEEMVLESRPGDCFVLGASTWRIDSITHDRVLVVPAPGEPGQLPFWRGEQATRPLELGQRMGRLLGELAAADDASAVATLTREHCLSDEAAQALCSYVRAQAEAADGAIPSDRTIVIERCRDELGDWRICILTPFGGQILAPWALAIRAMIRQARGLEVELSWTNDGISLRFPNDDTPPATALLVPSAEDFERVVTLELGKSAVFAARFREAAARALLLPRRRPGQRTPLWRQRKKSQDLLAVAEQYTQFPIVLEAYRECMRDLFDLPALGAVLRDVRAGIIAVRVIDSRAPSPFARSLLFSYVANYLYDGDAPPAERKAQALSIDQAQLRELLGEAELRELLDPEVLREVTRGLQRQELALKASHADGVHDLLLLLGDLTADELRARYAGDDLAAALASLEATRRIVPCQLAGEARLIAVEDAGRYHGALGVVLPEWVPDVFREGSPQALAKLMLRYTRTHATVTAAELAARFGVGRDEAQRELEALVEQGALVSGALRPGGDARDYADAEVLRSVRRRTLAALRREVEAVPREVYTRQLLHWHGVAKPRPGLDALLDCIDKLQGVPLLASALETEVLPARVADYSPAMLDTLAAAGEIVWCGVEPVGEHDGRLALYLTDKLGALWQPATAPAPAENQGREERLVAALGRQGALFFADLHEAAGGGFPGDTLDALWALVWRGVVSNDMFKPLRAFVRGGSASRHRPVGAAQFRSRRSAPEEGLGRWSLVAQRASVTGPLQTPTQRAAALADQLLARHGVLTRELVNAEGVSGGFQAIYAVFSALEEAGRIRRGYFVADVGSMQFALPAAVDLLRRSRALPESPMCVALAATDPANPFGTALPWPEHPSGHFQRSAGATVLLVDGALAAYLPRAGGRASTLLPADEPARTRTAQALATGLAALAERRRDGAGLLLASLDGLYTGDHPLAPYLQAAGFAASPQGYYLRRAG